MFQAFSNILYAFLRVKLLARLDEILKGCIVAVKVNPRDCQVFLVVHAMISTDGGVWVLPKQFAVCDLTGCESLDPV